MARQTERDLSTASAIHFEHVSKRFPQSDGTTAAVDDVTLRIDDEAGPFDMPVDHAGLGLQSISDRADAIAGEYRFNPLDGHPRHRLEVRVKRGEAPALPSAE